MFKNFRCTKSRKCHSDRPEEPLVRLNKSEFAAEVVAHYQQILKQRLNSKCCKGLCKLGCGLKHQPFHNPLRWKWYASDALPDSAHVAWNHQLILSLIHSAISANLIS